MQCAIYFLDIYVFFAERWERRISLPLLSKVGDSIPSIAPYIAGKAFFALELTHKRPILFVLVCCDSSLSDPVRNVRLGKTRGCP
jgi:hypothetical protein